jgi:hypothetical protein
MIEQEFYTAAEVMKIFSVGKATVYQHKERLGAIPWLSGWRFAKARVDEVREYGLSAAGPRRVGRGRPRRSVAA